MYFMIMAFRLLCVLGELCVKPDLLFMVFRSFHGGRSLLVSGCGAFLLKISGTSIKTIAKCPFCNNFPVPVNAWDKPGTTVGQASIRHTTRGRLLELTGLDNSRIEVRSAWEIHQDAKGAECD